MARANAISYSNDITPKKLQDSAGGGGRPADEISPVKPNPGGTAVAQSNKNVQAVNIDGGTAPAKHVPDVILPKEETSSVTASDIVAGTGLGPGIILPTQEQADKVKQDVVESQTVSSSGIILPTQEQVNAGLDYIAATGKVPTVENLASKTENAKEPNQSGAPDVLPSAAEAKPEAATQTTVPEVVLPQSTWTPVQAQTVTAPQMPEVPTVDIDAMRSQLQQWQETVNAQNAAKIDYATNQSITELQRAEEDAQAQFKEQAESVALDERQGMDNSALYAEARGDKGGIGQAQYNQIQAAAAQNRLAVQQQQTKLSTDTARQIADLRAQGEFEKADAVLETAQAYLTQLTQLEQWAANYGLSAAEFEATLAQWQAEYNAEMAKYQTDVDMYNAEMEYNAGRDQVSDQQWAAEMAEDQRQFNESAKLEREQMTASNQLKEQNQMAEMGMSLLDAGMIPSDAQLKAMGITKEEAQEYIIAAQLTAANTAAGKSQFGTSGATDVNSLYQKLKDAGVTTAEGALAQLTAWGVTSPGNYSDGFTQWYRNNRGTSNATGGITQGMCDQLDIMETRSASDAEMYAYIESLNISDEDKNKLLEAYNIGG